MEDAVVRTYETVMPDGCTELDEVTLELVGVPAANRSVREERRVDSGLENGELWPAVVREYLSGAIEVETTLSEPGSLFTLRVAGHSDGTQAVTVQEALLALADAVARFV